MEKNIENEYNIERKDRELLLFDKGFTELPYNEKNEKKNIANNNLKRKNINCFTVYLVLFKNTLNSKSLVPKEELKLRLNIIRKYLPPYLNCQKNIENSNTSSIMKKFSFHLYSKNNLMTKLMEKKQSKVITFFEEENENENLENNRKFERKKEKTKTQIFSSSKLNLSFLSDKKQNNYIPKLKTISEEIDDSKDFQVKRTPIKQATLKTGKSFEVKKFFISPKKEELRKRRSYLNLKFLQNKKNVKVKLDNKISNVINNIEDNDKEIVIRTPNDYEYPLILTEKRLISNNNQTYFLDFLNKLNEETKNEKITTYKNEVTSQILKFNEMYFDKKMDDFSQDNLFKELKNTCDIFINKFNCDSQEEKNLADLDKFL